MSSLRRAMSRWAREGEEPVHPSWQPAVQPIAPAAKRPPARRVGDDREPRERRRRS